ncbi:MAG: EAL domain-containing protein [Thermoanaerobaculia bacterium]
MPSWIARAGEMGPDRLMELATQGLDAAGALAVVLLVLALRRRHSKPYLLHWLYSSAALLGFALLTTVWLLLAPGYAPAHPFRFLSGLGASIAGFLQLGWLVFACRDLARFRPVTRLETRRIIILLSAAGAVNALVTLGARQDAAMQTFFQLGIHSFLAGAAAGLGGWWIWRSRHRGESTPFALFSISLLIWGAVQIAQSGVFLHDAIEGGNLALSIRFGITDLVFQGAIALGITISLLEDEREAAVLAASQVEHIAYHDLLTGLPNRALFFDRLIVAMAHATRHGHRLAILFFDLDRFKTINDSLGHSVGDTLLKTVAERIRKVVRQDDTVARFGGDEFVILTQINGNIQDAGKVARKTLDALALPFRAGQREVVVTSSIGIAVFPNDGNDIETLVKNADTAMYRAKEQGRDNFQFYTPSMNARSLELLELENDLRRALGRGEFSLHYQPLIDLASGRVFGLEALLRWQHPTRGLLLPESFISTAESTGLIVPIGKWVLKEACAQARGWQRQLGFDLIVCVNLSARQFHESNLIEHVREALEESGLRARYLELEITESSAMRDVQASIRILRELKELGVRIAIDDFGTGYSSLSYLRQFPVDTLKLDQSFVREITVPEDGAIASGVIAMAHSLKLMVLAEGVETLGQLDFLKRSDCDRLQGFLFSRPLAPVLFEKFIQHNRSMIDVA